jgi:hypothetical protein
LEFQPLALEHIELVRPYFGENKSRICDCTVGGTFFWRDYFKTWFALEDGVLYLKVKDLMGRVAFACPMGCSDSGPIFKILDYCQEKGYVPEFCMVPEENIGKLSALLPKGEVYTDRSWYDYLYLSENIKNLQGRKYSGQRNHINKFSRLYPDWTFEEICGKNLGKVRAFVENFIKLENEQKNSETLREGNRKIIELIDNYGAYKMCGGALTAGGAIIGVSFGEVVGDTLFVHIEKADRSYEGAYPVLVREFARKFAGDGVNYINREEDDGDEGLRTSKLSYHPEKLLEKFALRVNQN